MFTLRNATKVLTNCRNASTNVAKNGDISPIFTNRNPRNLEKLRIGYKPDGYHVDAPGKRFWHKYKLYVVSRWTHL